MTKVLFVLILYWYEKRLHSYYCGLLDAAYSYLYLGFSERLYSYFRLRERLYFRI